MLRFANITALLFVSDDGGSLSGAVEVVVSGALVVVVSGAFEVVASESSVATDSGDFVVIVPEFLVVSGLLSGVCVAEISDLLVVSAT